MKLERNKLFMVLLLILFIVLVHPAERARPDDGLSILISNDYGFNAPGLQALVEALIPIGKLVIAAPATDQSGQGMDSLFDPHRTHLGPSYRASSWRQGIRYRGPASHLCMAWPGIPDEA